MPLAVAGGLVRHHHPYRFGREQRCATPISAGLTQQHARFRLDDAAQNIHGDGILPAPAISEVARHCA